MPNFFKNISEPFLKEDTKVLEIFIAFQAFAVSSGPLIFSDTYQKSYFVLGE